jgi:hypothetical protein
MSKTEAGPVAFVAEVHMSRYTLEWNGAPRPEGTPLYAHPPAQEQQSAISPKDCVWARNGHQVCPSAAPAQEQPAPAILRDAEIDEACSEIMCANMAPQEYDRAVARAIERLMLSRFAATHPTPAAQEQPAPAWWVRDSEPPHFYAPAFHKGPQPPAPLTEAEARAAGWRPFYATHPTPAAQEQPAPAELPDDGELAAWLKTAADLRGGSSRRGEVCTRAAHLLENAYLFASKLRKLAATHPTPAERAEQPLTLTPAQRSRLISGGPNAGRVRREQPERSAAEMAELCALEDAAGGVFAAGALAEQPPRDAVQQGLAEALAAERERLCVAIKAEDDHCVTEGDYMLDSDDCISVIRGTWKRPDYSPAPKGATLKGQP